MNFELKRVNARKAASVSAAVYGALMLVMAVIFIPLLLLSPDVDQTGAPVSKGVFLVMLVLYPVFGAVGGWLSGYFLSYVYNLVAKRFGGLQFEGSRMDLTDRLAS